MSPQTHRPSFGIGGSGSMRESYSAVLISAGSQGFGLTLGGRNAQDAVGSLASRERTIRGKTDMKRTQTVPGFAFALAILVGASSYAEPTVTLAPGSTVSIAGTPTVNLSPGGTVTVSGMQFDSGGNLKVAATKTNTCAPVAGRIIPIVNSSEAPPLIV